ncbi:hypothetical protein [Caulobacter sp. FWC26]|uniref:hypothetical protein n=1 Tax=Caulobacter sp. FWC26 TaxID=69665 RepID=UPI000FD8D883|nr:hypothetical protein [Caulobacter sp. FWC26]
MSELHRQIEGEQWVGAEMNGSLLFRFPPGFPIADVEALGARLAATGGVTPGFTPASVGMLDYRAILYMREMEGWQFQMLPDRNLVTRLAAIAQHGAPAKDDKPTRLAVDLMAFCQAMDIQVEPSIAYHELAHRESNATAHEELRWFRPADHNNVQAWIDLAMGRRQRLELGKPTSAEDIDLALPLRRWRRNYIAALKVAELGLSDRAPADRARELMRWMFEDFMLAGSALAFALYYFAPHGPKGGLMKGLRGRNREDAIAGVRNAAWDITQLSDFVQRVSQSEQAKTRYFFATADEGLAHIAPAVMSDTEKLEGAVWLGVCSGLQN